MEDKHFMDKNTLFACLLVGVAWLAWDTHIRKKYPPVEKAQTPVPLSAEKGSEKALRLADTLPAGAGNEGIKKSAALPEKIVRYEHSYLSFELSSRGMGFKSYQLNNILDREGRAIWIFRSPPKAAARAFETRLDSRPLHFKIQREGNVFKGVARAGTLVVYKTLKVVPENFAVHTWLRFKNLQNHLRLNTLLVPGFQAFSESKGFFSFSQPDSFSFFIRSEEDTENIYFYSKEDMQEKDKKIRTGIQLAALGGKYFGQAWVDESDTEAEFRFFHEGGMLLGELQHRVLDKERFSLKYQAFMGPKSMEYLKRQHPTLVEWVDFGWFGGLARIILKILRFFYSLVGNWGFSIILLTLLVRFLLLPLVISSHRSMETMKQLQPEVSRIREKFKKDPKRMNQEVMALMKTHKANPLGGCLPMLLQIPVFWALWKALGGSYSLYRSPFIFWIRDLSWKDPYYVLPVLIGGLMFVQQKITPVSVNPEMAKAMAFLPVIITVFMLNLPSGLTLYVLVSSLFGLLQQFYIARPQVGNLKKGG